MRGKFASLIKTLGVIYVALAPQRPREYPGNWAILQKWGALFTISLLPLSHACPCG